MQNSILWHFTLFAGMEAVGLKSFIEKYPKSVHILFPSVSEATILGAELKLRLRFEDETLEANRPVVDMFLEYIDVLENRKEGTVIMYRF